MGEGWRDTGTPTMKIDIETSLIAIGGLAHTISILVGAIIYRTL